jgi:trk system potassium uptake protein TrkA
MNIVIVGAGDIGRYVATIMSKESHNVIVIDHDKEKLRALQASTDIATREGSGTDWQLLDDLLELYPDMLIALTHDDEVNLVTCSLAKQLGYPTTIARVHDNRFLNRTRLDFGRIFDVDHFICPELLTAHEILKYISSMGALGGEYFAHGAVQLTTLKIPETYEKQGVALSKLLLPAGIMVGLIYRGNRELIFPHGADRIMPGDEVTFIGETEAIDHLDPLFGIERKKIESVVLIGGSLTAMHLAKLLELRGLGIRIFEKDEERAIFLSQELPGCTVIHHDAMSLDFLRSEKIDQADLVVSCTSHDESNIFASMLAKEAGCKDVLMILSHRDNLPLLDRLGIQHVVSPVVCATNRILSQAFTGTVNTLISLYENRAEIVEVNVSTDSQVVGIPLNDLGPLLPKDFLIAMIQNRGRIMVANGNRIISPGDTVIVITTPSHVAELEKIF